MRPHSAFLALLVFLAPHAWGEEHKPARLEYEAEPGLGCVDAATFAVMFEPQPCDPTWTASEGPLVRVRVRKSEGALRCAFRIDDGKEEEKSGHDCDSLLSTVVTAIAFRLDPCAVPEPKIESISPSFASPGDRVAIDVYGASFRPGATVTIGTDGEVVVERTEFRDPTHLIATAAVPESASVEGLARRVAVTNPGGAVGSRGRLFAIVPVQPPVISTVEPREAVKGETLLLDVVGRDFRDGATVAFPASPDIRVAETIFVSPSRVRARLVVDGGTTQFSARDVSVTNPVGEKPTAIAAAAFTVIDTPPVILSVTPPRGRRGKTVSLVVRGSGFHPDAEALFEGAGLAILEQRVVAEDALAVTLQVASDAPMGPRGVSVVNPRGKSRVHLAGALTIEELPPPPPPPPITLYSAGEGAYSFWSGGRYGADQSYQSSAIAGDFVAGGVQPLGTSVLYTLDVLVSGHGATKRDRRSYTRFEQWGRNGKPADEYVTDTITATALRASVRSDSRETGVSLGVVVGGMQETGCRHDRTGNRGWATPLCGEFQQWAAFPSFGLRLGPLSRPHATLGFLDGRTLSGNLGHIGVGVIFANDIKGELAMVASMEGVGPRLELLIPVGRRMVIMPSASGGLLYDSFLLETSGRNSSWLRAGVGVGLRQWTEKKREYGNRRW